MCRHGLVCRHRDGLVCRHRHVTAGLECRPARAHVPAGTGSCAGPAGRHWLVLPAVKCQLARARVPADTVLCAGRAHVLILSSDRYLSCFGRRDDDNDDVIVINDDIDNNDVILINDVYVVTFRICSHVLGLNSKYKAHAKPVDPSI